MLIINNKHSPAWYKIKRTKNLLSRNLDYFFKMQIHFHYIAKHFIEYHCI